MKRRIFGILAVCVLAILPGCGCDDGGNIDLVFINGSNTAISAVSAGAEVKGETTQHADGSPLKHGDSFGFEAGEYPVVVAACSGAQGKNQMELGRVTLYDPPDPGERWYITARNGAGGLVLTADSRWPEDVE